MYPIQHLQPTDQGYHTFLWRGKSQNIQHRHSACTEVVTTKVTCKGQIISKCILVSSISSKKTNERIRLYYYEISSRLVFVRFWGEIEDTKKPFRNDLTFSKTENTVTAIDARTYRYMGTLSKFRYSEKATKIKKIYVSHFVFTLLSRGWCPKFATGLNIILSLVFLLISNLKNGLCLHQCLMSKTTEANKSLKTDANRSH